MKPTQYRKTNKQKSYDDLFWAIRKCLMKLRCGECYCLVNHYMLKDIFKPFPVGLRCEGFWWPTCKVCFLRKLFPQADYLQRIQHKQALCTITCHTIHIFVFGHCSPWWGISVTGMGQSDSVLWVFIYTFPSSTRTSYTWFW